VSYGFDLVTLPSGIDRNEAFRKKLEEQARAFQGVNPGSGELGPVDPSKEQAKGRLAAALQARHPTLEVDTPDYSAIAKDKSISEAEARRRFRDVELNEHELSIQILLFDDAAGATFSFAGDPQACVNALRVLWDCLEILESDGGFSTYDPQIDKVLDLNSDFEAVLKCACGVDAKTVGKSTQHLI
jgi:hypothetical protein